MRLRGLSIDPFVGVGVPKSGAVLFVGDDLVVNLYQRLVVSLLPVSVALTQTL